jgi:hypothetical protein
MFHTRPAQKVRAYCPRLEVLEDRTLLSTYLVDHLADDMVGTGLNGSLRYAITQAVNGDAITFGVTGTVHLAGYLDLTHSISIDGPGADLLTLDGGGHDTVLYVGGSVVIISGLAIANGAGEEGGGIDDNGTLTLNDVAITGNSAIDGGGIAIPQGGYGESLTLNNVTVSGNSAQGAGYAIDGGAGIWNNGGTVTINNSTISGNSTDGFGGGIWNAQGATVTLSDSTVSGNSAENYGGAIWNNGVVALNNSTFSGNSDYDCVSIVNYDGGSEFGSGSVFIGNSIIDSVDGPNVHSNGHNLIGGNPLLGPLQNNGGPTLTHALLPGSPALNVGDPNQLGTADQRGVVRSGGVNIGAYQASASALVLTAPDTVTAGTPFDVTVKAVDPFQQTAVGYHGMVHFVTSNGAMADYTFMAADGGQHTFSGLALRRAGPLTVTGTDTSNDSITGSTTFTITPAAADHLLFLQQPTDTAAGQTISAVIVEVVDASGNVVTSDNSDAVTLSLGTNPSGGTLSGTLTLTVVSGVAMFSDLSIDLVGMGYTLHASVGGGLPGLDSNPFNITM